MNKRLIYAEDAIDAIEQLVIPEDMCVFEILSHIELAIGTLPSAQPEKMQLSKEDATKGTTFDCISRQAAIDSVCEVCENCEYFKNEKLIQTIKDLPSAQPRWIPVTERLPEEDVEVLISYRYKEGEGDTSHTDIDITSYGQMYFGGNKVGNHKHWRAPFEYFESNYEVVAWMPLPPSYKGGQDET